MHAPTANEFYIMLPEIQKLMGIAGKIARLIQAQSEAMEAGDLETLSAILDQKQTLIDQVLAFRTLKERYELSLYSSPDKIPQALTSAYLELEDTLKSLVETDQKTIESLKERHAETAGRLQLLMRDRQAADCYIPTQKLQPKPRIDISG
jgi:hypothetical protein